MKKKSTIQLLAAVMLLAALLSGCGAAGKDTGQTQPQPSSQETESTADLKGANAVMPSQLPTPLAGGAADAEQTAAGAAYPVDLRFTECTSLDISRAPDQIMHPHEETVEGAHEGEPTQSTDGIQGILGGKNEEPQEEVPADTYLVFRYLDPQTLIYRIQVRAQEASGLVLTGRMDTDGVHWDTSETGALSQDLTQDPGIQWDASGDTLAWMKAKLSDALLGALEWTPCQEAGLYAVDTRLTYCLVIGRTVLYADGSFTGYQMQSYDDNAVLTTVVPLAQGAGELLMEGAREQVIWDTNTFPEMDILPRETPTDAEEPSDVQELIAGNEEELERLHEKIRQMTILVIVLAAVLLLLVITNLVSLLSASKRRKSRKARKSDRAPAAQVPGTGRTVKSCGIVHNIGRRSGQQDSFDVIDCAAGTLAVVADGMGGLADGDKVSQKIIATFRADSAKLRPGRTDGILHQLIGHVNQEVNRMLGTANQYKCGSTLLSVLVEKDTMQWATVGDSRIYLYRGGSLLQLNREHIYKADLLERAINGKIGFAEAMRDPQLNRLSSFIGMGELRHVDSSLDSVKVLPGDRILMMSDGVFNTLSNDEIADVIRSAPNAADAAKRLEQEVLLKQVPNQDNFTCVILEI